MILFSYLDGELLIKAWNLGHEHYHVKKGERIAQLRIVRGVHSIALENGLDTIPQEIAKEAETSSNPSAIRTGGFGSTGQF